MTNICIIYIVILRLGLMPGGEELLFIAYLHRRVGGKLTLLSEIGTNLAVHIMWQRSCFNLIGVRAIALTA